MYDAIMKAADQIEQYPERFVFIATGVPRRDGGLSHNCGSPGCALGWIAFYGRNVWVNRLCGTYGNGLKVVDLPNNSSSVFYCRLNKYESGWMGDARLCAKALRQYAEEYCAPEQPKYEGILETVKVIFDQPSRCPV